MFVGNNGSIYVETAHEAYPFLINFLISCTEPVSRTHHIEHYRLDASSLSAATAEGIYSCEMIRHFLRYFRLNEKREMAINLAKYKALLSWAASPAAENDPTNYPRFHHVQLEQLLYNTVTSNISNEKCHNKSNNGSNNEHNFIANNRDCSMDRNEYTTIVKHECDEAKVDDIVKVENERKESPPRRMLKLLLPTSNVNSNTDAKDIAFSTIVNDKNKVIEGCDAIHMNENTNVSNTSTFADRKENAQLPIIHCAVSNPHCLQELPKEVEEMLTEEEQASRMLIVLQPRLRRFGSTQNVNNINTTKSANFSEMNREHKELSATFSPSPDALYYFIVSRERRHLESVMDGIAEYLEPVFLHGVARYIISDIDRDWGISREANVQQVCGSNNNNNKWSEEELSLEKKLCMTDHSVHDDTKALQKSYTDATTLESENYNFDMSVINRPSVLRRLFDADYHVTTNADNKMQKRSNLRKESYSRIVYKCQIKDGMLRAVKERLYKQYGVRADCFYDYLQDHTIHVPQLTFSPHVHLRHYQTASLERFKHNNKAHHGVVVLPCGAGKTLTGIGAAVALQKKTIVMCINNMSVFQWQREFVKWTNLTPSQVTICTAKEKQMPGEVFITTYNMIIAKRSNEMNTLVGRSAKESEAILNAVMSEPWGLLILDEVHTALALHFQEVLDKIKHKCVLGLSATLLREDDKIADLRHLVGPKLYEANWLELTKQGYLANVECAEIQCPLPMPFFLAYHEHTFDVESTENSLRHMHNSTTSNNSNNNNRNKVQRSKNRNRKKSRTGKWNRKNRQKINNLDSVRDRSERKKRMRGGVINALSLGIAACNPFKLWCTQALLEFHRNRSPPDKVIIYCDYLADVRYYATMLHLPFMDQRTSEAERNNLLQYFQYSDNVNAIILTRVGDVALDLPCASVIIQISGLGASRRQEAQRLGRILRPKPASLDNTCAYFYTLVSQDTHEIRTSYERQSWLRDQGFAYRVINCNLVLSEFARVGGERCCVGPPQWWFQVAQQREHEQEQEQEKEEEYEEEEEEEEEEFVYQKSNKANAFTSREHISPTQEINNLTTSTSTSTAARTKLSECQYYRGCWWAPFSFAASMLLQQYFNRGKDGCVLSGDILGKNAEQILRAELERNESARDIVCNNTLYKNSNQGSKGKSKLSHSTSVSMSYLSALRDSWSVEFSSTDAPYTFGTVILGSTDTPEPWQVRRITFGLLGQPHQCIAEKCSEEENKLCNYNNNNSVIKKNTNNSCINYALEQLLNRKRARMKLNRNERVNNNKEYDDNEEGEDVDRYNESDNNNNNDDDDDEDEEEEEDDDDDSGFDYDDDSSNVIDSKWNENDDSEEDTYDSY